MRAAARTREGAGAMSVWARAGCVLAAWLALVGLEHVAVGFGYRALFAGSWEMAHARRFVTPIALAALLPLSAIALAVSELASRATASRRARMALAIGAACAGGLVAYGVSFGRHMQSWIVRGPFIAAIAIGAGAAAWALAPAIARAADRRPHVVAAVGIALAIAFWCADAFVLPRLYPAFHAALLAMTLASGALGALVFRAEDDAPRSRAPAIAGPILVVIAGMCALGAPAAARRIQSEDNMRITLVEHAPILGRAVWIATLLAPPAPIDEGAPALAGPGEVARALDWTGRDIVLLTVDALRADHVSSYGYARSTTPNIDALAREGALFEAAYCPTPHTSYSVTSLMTGKYMRPLLALGLGQDSETWAAIARRYGYRTAAFYPPAVFFIDESRFTAMRERGLDFEYRKEEFASPELRASQVSAYLANAPSDKPLFLWVHFFEPHEPYVMHADHAFGAAAGAPSDVDAYDSEIAAADAGIGAIVQAVRARRPGAVIAVTADHGEEFGDHGGRYHGTTVYEEQVRVPLIVVGPGVQTARVKAAVQTIDLLPTVISALGIPRPARVRGRDLGALLARKEDAARDPGLAFAETDEYTMLARGDARLVCARRAAACARYDVASDPKETRDRSRDDPARAKEMRRAMTSIASEHGRYETGEATTWPEALRRGMEGDADAAEEVASLLDDASAPIRAKAAEVCFDLHASSTAPQLRRALAKSDDEAVRRGAALALLRMGDPPSPLAEALARARDRDADVTWRRRAALAFAESGDARGGADLAAWWAERGAEKIDFEREKELVRAIAKIRDRAAVPALVASLDDLRLRPFVADALGAIGDPAARVPLLAALAREPYVTARPHEARALVALGGASWSSAKPAAHVDAMLTAPATDAPLQLIVLSSSPGAACTAALEGAPLAAREAAEAADVHVFDILPDSPARPRLFTIDDPSGVVAAWLLPHPPAPDATPPP